MVGARPPFSLALSTAVIAPFASGLSAKNRLSSSFALPFSLPLHYPGPPLLHSTMGPANYANGPQKLPARILSTPITLPSALTPAFAALMPRELEE